MDTAEYIELINRSFLSRDNLERRTAEDTLMKVCQNDDSCIDKLISIIDSTQDDILRISTVQIIVTVIKKLIAIIKPYPLQQRLHHVDLIVTALTKNHNQKVKSSLSIGLQQLITFDKQDQFTTRLQTHIQQSVETKQVGQIEAALYIANALLNCSVDNNKWLQYIFMAGLLDIGNLKEYWAEIVAFACKKYLSNTKPINPLDQEFILCNDQLAQALQQSFKLNIYGEDQLVQIFLLQAYYSIYSFIIAKKEKYEKLNCPFYYLLEIQVPHLLMSLLSYTTDHRFNHNNLKNIINHILKILSVSAQSKKMYPFYQECKMAILLDIIYPLLTCNKIELEEMNNDPQEFLNLTIDCIEEQKSDVIKTSTSLLLNSLCKHIDGSTTFISQMAILICQLSIDSLENNNIQNFGILNDFKDHYLFKMGQISLIECSLLILSIMSYQLQGRSEMGILFRQFLAQNTQFLLNFKLDGLIKMRLCTFIGQFCIQLLRQNDQIAEQYIDFLVKQIQTPQPQIIIYSTIDALRSIVEENKLQNIIAPFVVKIIIPLCQTLLNSELDAHFELIKEIMKIHQLPIDVMKISIQLIISKIMRDQTLLQEGQLDRQIQINLSWNILKLLPEIQNITPDIYIIEKQFEGLYNYLEKPEQIDFEEDIFVMISQIIQKTHMISELQRQVLIYCPINLVKQKYRLGQLFEMLNYYIIYGSVLFQERMIQQIIVDMAIKVMNEKDNTESDQCEGVLLLHLLIQQHCKLLCADILVYLFEQVIQRFKQNISNNFLKVKLVGVFLSAILCDQERTFGILANSIPILEDIVQIAPLFDVDYDTKLFVSCLCSYMVRTQSRIDILYCITEMLLRQYQFDQKKKDEEDEDMFEFNEELEEIKMSMDIFKSQIKNVDEFLIFQQFYSSIRNQSIEFLKQYPDLLNKMEQVLRINKFEDSSRVLWRIARRKCPNS